MYINKRFKFWKWILYIEIDTYINISKYKIPPLFIDPPISYEDSQRLLNESMDLIRKRLSENLAQPSPVLQILKDRGIIKEDDKVSDDRHTDKSTT